MVSRANNEFNGGSDRSLKRTKTELQAEYWLELESLNKDMYQTRVLVRKQDE